MFDRSCSKALILSVLALPIAGCTNPMVASIQVNPSSQALVVGQSVQLTAIGSYGHGTNNPPSQNDVTSLAMWASSSPSVATVSSTGLASAVGDGTTTITASMNGFTGLVSSSATITVVSPSGSGGSVSGLLSLTIIPTTVTVDNLQGTGQFLAIGTFTSSPTVRDLTNSVNWISSAPNIFPISTNGTGAAASGTTAGIITAYGSGNADVIAEAVDPTTGSIQTAQATFNCPLVLPTKDSNGNITNPGSCYPGSEASALLSTLTIYSAGLNSTGWLITAPSATGTLNVIHCGPASTTVGLGAPVCTATYPIGSIITVTAPSEPGVNFGGWTSNCIATNPVAPSPTGPNTCTVDLTTNDTVGAIFN